MGDHTTQPGAPAEVLPLPFPHPYEDIPAGATPASAQDTYPSDSAEPILTSTPTPGQYQKQTAGSPHALAAQPNMTQQQRTAPFDMNAMANALPQQQPYRGQFQHGHNNHDAPRYSPAATMFSPGTPTQNYATQFGTPGMMSALTAQQQQYYVPQHARMPQFYPAAAAMSPQPPSTLPPRTDLGYYSSPVVVSQPPHAALPLQYYYTPAVTVPGQTLPAQGQFLLGQYGVPSFQQQHPDPRTRQPQQGSQGVPPAAPSAHQGNSMFSTAFACFAYAPSC
jgi:hypothetical protein